MRHHLPGYPAPVAAGRHATALGPPALGVGGLGGGLVHLFIWRLAWRGGAVRLIR